MTKGSKLSRGFGLTFSHVLQAVRFNLRALTNDKTFCFFLAASAAGVGSVAVPVVRVREVVSLVLDSETVVSVAEGTVYDVVTVAVVVSVAVLPVVAVPDETVGVLVEE